MNKIIKTLMVALLVAGTACTSQAQGDDTKIKVKITKEVDGKKQTFEREYASAEEMREDAEYREFAGDGEDFDFYFNRDGVHERIIDLREGGGTRAFSFSFGDDNSMPFKRLKGHHFGGTGQNGFWFGDEDATMDLHSFNSEEYEEELEEKMAELEQKLEGLDENLQKEIMKAMKEIEDMSSGAFPRRINRGGISIEDVGDEFGQRGKVAANSRFDIDPDFMIMNNRLTLRFKVEEAGELTVKISNDAGKDIYNRYFEKFGGTFSDQIDFSKYADGKYLLEITKDKKRLTKKIVID